MNAKQRKQLERYMSQLIDIAEAIREMANEEQEKYDNLTEGLQATERGQQYEDNAGTLESIADDVENATTDIDDLINQ